MKVPPGATDVTTYFELVDSTAGGVKTLYTIANLDATYIRDRATAVKNDLTALAAADSAHGDNTGTINGKLRRYVAMTQLVDITAVDFTAADRTKLEAVYGKLPANNLADQTLLAAAIAATMQAGATERNAIADALLDRANAIETGKKFRQALRIAAAILAGKVSGAGTGTETFLGIDGATPRVRVTTDPAGNRLTVTFDPS
jgi:hypothetical protein